MCRTVILCNCPATSSSSPRVSFYGSLLYKCDTRTGSRVIQRERRDKGKRRTGKIASTDRFFGPFTIRSTACRPESRNKTRQYHAIGRIHNHFIRAEKNKAAPSHFPRAYFNEFQGLLSKRVPVSSLF